ncbi:Hypothetical_protein [Hexamita inflata]|uniref:Hypothetical_protein n=1 Tax=Hexamita inflata TaxID=28002 RepID=A0AA86PSN1_9EUKA|nr:Hypothetical protein HINF_LOCUS33079 [Hexamita inflata]
MMMSLKNQVAMQENKHNQIKQVFKYVYDINDKIKVQNVSINKYPSLPMQCFDLQSQLSSKMMNLRLSDRIDSVQFGDNFLDFEGADQDSFSICSKLEMTVSQVIMTADYDVGECSFSK